jgi:hypothetical protein
MIDKTRNQFSVYLVYIDIYACVGLDVFPLLA